MLCNPKSNLVSSSKRKGLQVRASASSTPIDVGKHRYRDDRVVFWLMRLWPKTRLCTHLHFYLLRIERLTRPGDQSYLFLHFVRRGPEVAKLRAVKLELASATLVLPLPASLIVSCKANARYKE